MIVNVYSYLMATTYQLQIVHAQEPGHNIRTECETNASIILAPILWRKQIVM